VKYLASDQLEGRPAAVASERRSAEEFRSVRRRLVGEQDQHFALHIHALEIVPAEFRCHDAVADEDGFRIELIRCLLEFAHAHIIIEQAARHEKYNDRHYHQPWDEYKDDLEFRRDGGSGPLRPADRDNSSESRRAADVEGWR
jgi:hypothetical protein